MKSRVAASRTFSLMQFATTALLVFSPETFSENQSENPSERRLFEETFLGAYGLSLSWGGGLGAVGLLGCRSRCLTRVSQLLLLLLHGA
jgi:hypothetical protein